VLKENLSFENEENKKMKILILSGEVWKDVTNGGNILTGMFSDFDAEFSQVYCRGGTPENNICYHYYQMTDMMIFKSLIKHRPVGREFYIEKDHPYSSLQQNQALYSFFHEYRLPLFFAMRHLAWNCSNWKNYKFKAFLDSVNPDIIFAPCYGDCFKLKLTRFVAEYTGKPVISYISDDSYTLRQLSFSPLYWINRFSVRHQLCKTFPYYSLVYTMTEAQKAQCEKDFGVNMKVLLKSSPFGDIPAKKTVGVPIRLVYAGGIYLNRWKTLASIAKSLREINRNRVKMILDIYTGNDISPKIKKLLNDGVNSTVHSSVSQKELAEIYQNSDIALHVESFDLKNRLTVRMSFSTKIVDCLASGCAVMAICDEKQGGFEYLKNEDAAICISDAAKIKGKLMELVNSPTYILGYAKKARDCCRRNHDKNAITQMIKEDFGNTV